MVPGFCKESRRLRIQLQNLFEKARQISPCWCEKSISGLVEESARLKKWKEKGAPELEEAGAPGSEPAQEAGRPRSLLGRDDRGGRCFDGGLLLLLLLAAG
ncbi:MAG: hypothetical protein LUE08_04740, partial [Akkermansiaceae bacterium]|nr:hypothetical protein [Akkermansiaceae bacterium]